MKRTVLLAVAATCLAFAAEAEDGYELWLRYAPVADAGLRGHYLASVTGVHVDGSSEAPRGRGRAEARARGTLSPAAPSRRRRCGWTRDRRHERLAAVTLPRSGGDLAPRARRARAARDERPRPPRARSRPTATRCALRRLRAAEAMATHQRLDSLAVVGAAPALPAARPLGQPEPHHRAPTPASRSGTGRSCPTTRTRATATTRARTPRSASTAA